MEATHTSAWDEGPSATPTQPVRQASIPSTTVTSATLAALAPWRGWGFGLLPDRPAQLAATVTLILRRGQRGASLTRMWGLLEPIHVVTYFAPEARATADALGMRGFWMGYAAQRSAPLGAVGPRDRHGGVLRLPPRTASAGRCPTPGT